MNVADHAVLVGFGSYEGSVIAGRHWGARMKEMEVPPARSDSWESALHASGAENKLLVFDDLARQSLSKPIGHRAIGVVYHPQQERGNYVPTVVPRRYDAFIFLDQSRALHPLHLEPDGRQMPETFPFGV